MGTLAIDDKERKFLGGVAALALSAGLLGVVLGLSMNGSKTVSASYWAEILKVAGVSALPLVALAVRMPRTSGSAQWTSFATVLVFLAFPIALLVICVCLNRIALGAKDGEDPHDVYLFVTAIGAGLVLAAVAVRVAADVLDKIDTQS